MVELGKANQRFTRATAKVIAEIIVVDGDAKTVGDKILD